MTYEQIIKLFKSDEYENDVWLKIEHIHIETKYKYTTEELLEIYDNLGESS